MAEADIRRTLAEYCQLVDDGRWDDWEGVFTDDVVFGVMGQVLRGREAVRGFIEPNQQEAARGRHMLSEPLITLDGGTATVTTDYAFVAKDLTVLSAGRYHDTLRDDGDRWRIASREIVFLGDQPRGLGGDA